ncbi:DNA primase small subunit [Acrasis kona]|uniref:DNA primase n=1 Tax=Acrasis kona TaxID=1008807 RepID=A0AAW2ZEQ6_9EUKA
MVGTNDLRSYYQKFLPSEQIYSWLSYGDPVYFTKREFAFTRDEFFSRYQSFKNGSELKERLTRNERDIPERFEIGCVYSVPPSQQHSVSPGVFVPISKEFVLDIDISDYNDIRMCGCKESNYCRVCWKLMLCGVEVSDYILTSIFGFKNRLWVFSGGRGIHCWVGDESVRSLTNEGRSAVAEFMHLYQSSKDNNSGRQGKVDTNNLSHPSFSTDSKIFQICQKYFVDVFIDGMDILRDSDKYEKLLSFITDSTLKKQVHNLIDGLDEDDDASETWSEIVKVLNVRKNNTFVQAIVLSFVYPRLDLNVSKGLNHLLKSPFCIHPRTGYVCVPLDPKKDVPKGDSQGFYPEDQCPKVGELVNNNQEATKMMESRVEIFKKFVLDLKKQKSQEKLEESDSMLQF